LSFGADSSQGPPGSDPHPLKRSGGSPADAFRGETPRLSPRRYVLRIYQSGVQGDKHRPLFLLPFSVQESHSPSAGSAQVIIQLDIQDSELMSPSVL